MIYFLLSLSWHSVLTYIYGLYCLIIQFFRKHNRITGIPLQTGKVAIVTGGASGIGFYISKGLVEKNVHVIIGCKTAAEGKDGISRIREEFPNAKVDFIKLDLLSLQSVKDFAEEFLSRNLHLHILINNAGIMFAPYEETVDGYESTFQVNYLGHFYLIQLLLDKLGASATDNSFCRIINISSSLQALGDPDLEKIGYRCKHWYEYSPHKAYCDSKLMIVAASNYLNFSLQEKKARVVVNSLHPGIADSNLTRHLHWLIKPMIAVIKKLFYLSGEQGADTPLYVALSPDLERQGHGYYDNSEEVTPVALATNRHFQQRLWGKTEQLIKKSMP